MNLNCICTGLGITCVLESHVLMMRTPCVCRDPCETDGFQQDYWESPWITAHLRNLSPSCHIKPGDLDLSLTLRTWVVFFCEKRPFGWGFASWDSPLPLDADPGWELSHMRNAVPGLAIPHDTPGKCGSFVISLHRGKEKQAHQMNRWQGQNPDRNCDQGGRGRISVLQLYCPLSASRSPSWCGHSRRKGHSGVNIQPAPSVQGSVHHTSLFCYSREHLESQTCKPQTARHSGPL